MGIVAAIGGILVTWMLSLAGFFDILNNPLYDALIRFSPATAKSPISLLLVEYDDDDDTPETWPLLLQQLQVHQPAQVIFTSLPRQAPPWFYTRAASNGNVLFGRRVLYRTAEGDAPFLEVLPDSVPDGFESFGLVENPPANHGVHRHQHAAFTLDGQSYPALEVMAWNLRRGDNVRLPMQPYRINFNGGRHQLPRVSIKRVLAGGLVPELVRGHSVLIGPATSSQIAGLHTPLNPHHASISSLEFHGFALHTLLSGSMIKESGKLISLGLIFVIIGANLFVYQWMEMRLSSWITLVLMSLYVGMAWGLLTYANVWLPIAEILASQMGVFLLVFREKSVVRELSLQRMLRQTSAQLQEQSADASFHTATEHWSQVVTMLVQTLDVNRLILLDRVPGDHRLREVIAWQCSLDDIYERRRDYHRTPYSTAIKERGLTQAEERNFFTISTTTEVQYLMPLIFSGEVLGFWAFGIEPEIAAAIPKFKTIVEEFGNQIATLLYRRQEWLTLNASEQQQTLQRYLQLEGGDRTYHALNKSVTLL
ncbi:MAG: CHASE2 domain-containing protein, partial [Candidatus Tectomicrobia bacterium]|nr:CHASE2 domain-containing protein [Candidatus Tectomicrobia bacterium]